MWNFAIFVHITEVKNVTAYTDQWTLFALTVTCYETDKEFLPVLVVRESGIQ